MGGAGPSGAGPAAGGGAASTATTVAATGAGARGASDARGRGAPHISHAPAAAPLRNVHAAHSQPPAARRRRRVAAAAEDGTATRTSAVPAAGAGSVTIWSVGFALELHELPMRGRGSRS